MSRRLWAGLQAWRPARTRLLPPAEHQRALASARMEQHGDLAALYLSGSPYEMGYQQGVLASARLEQHGDLTALFLSGSPYEMGYQQGVLARDRIHGFRQAAYAYVTTLVQDATRLALPGWLARPLLFYQAAAYWSTLPADLVAEMQGIADGAGVHPIEVLVSTTIWEIYLVSGCSEFAVTGPATLDGTLLHAYNYDLMRAEHALIQPYLAALFYRPRTGIPFVTVNTVGSVGANAGMNEAGISVAWDNTYLRDDTLTRDLPLPTAPFIVTLRQLLQYSRSLDEAIETITRSLPRPLGDIVIIASARENRAVALETAGGVHAVREMEDAAIWSTNCFRSSELAPHDRRGAGRGTPDAEEWQRFPRYAAYAGLFASHRGSLTPASAAKLLRDPYPREAEGYLHPITSPRATICRDLTSWSLVMQPGSGRLWISETRLPGCQNRFLAFDVPAWQRMPDLDLPPTGYSAARACACCFLSGDLAGARTALDQALALDGPTAPLLLMRALLLGLAGDAASANEHLRQTAARWPGTPLGELARAWLAGSHEGRLVPIPFPSAIQPLLHFRYASSWQDRARPAPEPADQTS